MTVELDKELRTESYANVVKESSKESNKNIPNVNGEKNLNTAKPNILLVKGEDDLLSMFNIKKEFKYASRPHQIPEVAYQISLEKPKI